MIGGSAYRYIEEGMFLRVRQAERGGEQQHLPALLFIHGIGESGLCFENIIEHQELASFERLVPDLPGYGRSPWLEEPLSLQGHARVLAGLLKSRHTRNVVLIGHSMGGVVALLLAEMAPELVSAVVDIDGNKTLADCAFSINASSQPLEEFMREGFDALRDEIYRGGINDRALRGYYASLRFADPHAYHLNSVELVELSRDEGLSWRLAALEVPKLYIAGLPEGACPRTLEKLGEAGVPLNAVSPAGHWPFLDQPETFLRVLRVFLDQNVCV